MKKRIFVLFLVNISIVFSQFENYVDTNSLSRVLFDQIKIFPNPTNEILFIRNGNMLQSFHLMNMDGRIVKKVNGQTQFISLADLPVGQYFLFLEIQGFYRKYFVLKY